MGIWVQILPGSSEPIYSQIFAQVARAIAAKTVAVGDKLPTVRRLASELVVNPNTVARAYSLLEQQGLVSTKCGSGTFVADPRLRHVNAAALNALSERMDNIIAQSLNMGLSKQDISDMLAARIEQFAAERRKGGRNK